MSENIYIFSMNVNRASAYLPMLVGLVLFTCSNDQDQLRDYLGNVNENLFSTRIKMATLQDGQIKEASGIAASKINPGSLWTHNDSGDEARVFLVDMAGKTLATYQLQGIDVSDAEDIAIGPGPEEGVDYIYLADIGDNFAQRDTKYIYRFPEPVWKEEDLGKTISIENIDSISFDYPDGARDAETLLSDPLTGDLYIVSKRESRVHLYQFTYPQETEQKTEPELLGNLPLGSIVAGDISLEGNEVLLKSYDQVFYWKKEGGESLYELMRNNPVVLPYEREPQGEAITFASDQTGYYTLSEEVAIFPAVLYFYKRY